MSSLLAREVTIDEIDGVLVIGFAAENEEYLLLQRSLEPSEQDVALGHDAVYIERNSQLRSAYGGIVRVVLSSRAVVLELSEETAEAIGSEGVFRVDLDLESQRLEVLRESLDRLHGGGPERSSE
ncbi:MAG: Imm10 family immunity protein [Acidobacteriota bacterium]